MKKGLILSLFMLIVGLAHGQEQAPTASDSLPPLEVQRQIFIYSLAKKYNDQAMQMNSLYNILSYNPQNIAILDSLALMYFNFQQYASAALVSEDVIAFIPDDKLALEIAAISFERLGVKDRALPHYESLYLANNDIGLLYQIAFIQFDLKRYNEAITNSDVVIADAESDTRMMLFPKSNNENQQVSLKAATYRMRAMLEQERGNVDQAKDFFNKALEIAPDFELVKQQIAALGK